ncbi:hypothetical protein Misp01_69530 [Microtetraspora sp. NBRC 13810]|uniref:DUF5682 family protein n=1 Tax=Microtetraspora sp. NBRC 13810 TaxID=3030990 RepID=UPI0024A4C878|nr:DUF5682 family protein [Microtetraspora sp. NBRC 13810]GLW11825.1 hypothetical protein Misp01_69530 [Microtetraspora sp. NBRC 13810]
MPTETPAVTVLGVRHHGPGSARAVREELARLRPDVVLVEGPPEADGLVALAGDAGMEPPVALLAHVPGEPSRSAFWPFAEFSPEWQAIRHAVAEGVPVRFCDLPAALTLAEEPPRDGARGEGAPGDGARGDGAQEEGKRGGEGRGDEPPADPVGVLAGAAGYDDPERWWEDVVEHRRGAAPFEAVGEAMAAIREGYVPGEREARREAYMRRTLRRAIKDGFERIAVVCGAWHAPALTRLPPAAADDRLLRGLPKVKVETTWVPWTYGRLAARSGYGAGVESPGWYHHLFTAPDRPVERWLARAAGVLREEGLAVSPAHVIEAVRLAGGLAVLRGRPLAGLGEVTEAARAVLCEGDDLPVALIQRRMVVGERIGRVPEATPMVPLQRHLRDEQRRLRLRPEALDRDLDLDLRKPVDLDRSRLLHRLRVLGVGWGAAREGAAQGKGTFRESWRLAWRPEFDITLIEAGAWGTTVPAAATARVADLADPAKGVTLAELTALVETCLLADLPDALPRVLGGLSERAALDPDVTRLMAALPAMARALRYGDVRGTPAEGLGAIVSSMLARISAGLSPALTGLDDDATREMLGHVDGVHAATALLPGEARREWLTVLGGVAGREDLHGLIEGRLTRILLDAGTFDAGEVATRMARATSAGHPPARVAAWVEGFLAGGGLLLVHDAALLGLVDRWLGGLTPEAFVDVLPLLRRTFATFDAPERRAIGARVRASGGPRQAGETVRVDEERAAAAVRTVLTILGRTDG